MPFSQPPFLPEPFCTSGPKNSIPTGSASPAASLDDGFPPVTMIPLLSGGVPPDGKDVNGILFWTTQINQWLQAGMLFAFDATFATAIGGYPKGALVLSNDGTQVFQALALTSTDPNTLANVGVHWVPVIGESSWGLARICAVSGTANAIILTSSIHAAPRGTGTEIPHLLFFIAGSNNTAAVTVAEDGAAAVALESNSGGALVADDLVAGTLYGAVWNGTVYRLTQQVPSQVPVIPTIFGTQNDVTASRSLTTVYTNPSATLPMFVSVFATSGGGPNNDLRITVNSIPILQITTTASAALSVNGIVPPGGTYEITCPVGAVASITKWVETY